MSFDATARLRRPSERDRRPWHGAAFIVEALVLLTFLVASVAVTVQVMGASHERGTAAGELSAAVVMASNDAEAFAADPTTGDLAASEDGYELTRTVEQEATDAGTLYRAHIAVARDGAIVYELDTARYVASTSGTEGEVAR